ncbi:MAG: hypothetical protein WKG01_00525 [Kofleriaceae bacterium]
MRGAVGLGVVLVTALSCKGSGKRLTAWAEQREAERARDNESDRAEAEALAQRPILRPDGPGLSAGRYRLVEVVVEAEPFKRRAETWDAAPADAPELEVEVAVDGKHVATCAPEHDSLTTRCVLEVEISIDERSIISLEVQDDDHLLSDPVGGATLGDPGTWGLGIALPMVHKDRVKAASIVLRAVPTWWALYGWRVIGSGAGIALGLLALAVFRRSLFVVHARELVVDPPVAPVAPVAPVVPCLACDQPLAPGTTICSKCGAAQ